MSRSLILKKRRVSKSDRFFFECAKVAAKKGEEELMFEFLDQMHFDTVKESRLLRDQSFAPYRDKLKKILQVA